MTKIKKENDIETENMKVNDKIRVHLYTNGMEIKTQNFDEIFIVYKKDGKLGIDWNTERSPNTCEGNLFCPFDTFSGTTVIFENVETSKLYHFCNIKNVVAKIA